MNLFNALNEKFFHRSLRFQFLVVIALLLIIPVLVMLYDVFFASKSDEVIITDHEEKLKSIVQTRIVPAVEESVGKRNSETDFFSLTPAERTACLQNAFKEAAEPMVANYPGVRFGLYIPNNKQIFVYGFLREYRQLSPDEAQDREKRILNEADSGLIAVAASQRPLARLTSSLKEETFEYLHPVFVNNQLVAVAWADERLHPIFAQSRSFRTMTRYVVFLVLFLGSAGALLIISNLTNSVSRIKKGLKEMEKDISHHLPEMSGEVGQITMAINKMADALAEKEKLELEIQRSERLASLGRLVTGVAHELRNPIGVVKATVQVMETEFSGKPEIMEYTSVIKEQVDRQNRVIQELLDFGRPGRQILQPVDINSVMEKVLTFTLPMLRQSGIILETAFEQDIPKIMIDASKIKQVFVNLILNAIQAMPEGGSLSINTSHTANFAYVKFKDSGTGMEPGELAKIFDPFYTTKEYGTGLGLSISHQIIKSHNGHIDVFSKPGKGTEFIVYLPARQDQGGNSDDTQNTNN
ncbi:MAG: ATP-binding protein [Bacillota bacterium]